MRNKFIKKSKRFLSGFVAAAMAVTMVPTFPAVAKAQEKYPYTLFAGSSEEGAITVNAGNFTVNGNVAANGTIVSGGNMNINGTKTEHADESMIFIFDKIESQYFTGSKVDESANDYTLEETNININTPTEVFGEATLTGNININTALKAFEDVNLYGEVKNTNDSVIFSKYGDIIIDSQNVNLNGLVYAPFGDVQITAQNLNLNHVVIIADTITFNCPNVNANYSGNAAEFVGVTSELLDIPYNEWQYMKDENGNGIPDFIENVKNWSKFADTDSDKLPDCIERYIGSEPQMQDTDGDGMDDCYEAFELFTSPTKKDTDDNGIPDGDEDFDDDGLTNYEEYIRNTSPWMDDTDNDTLKDGEEVDIYGTNPLEPDTDGDGLDDADEIAVGTDPTVPDTDGDGILDSDERFQQTFTHIVENRDCVIQEVIVSMEGTGNLQTNTTVESVMNKDILCTEAAGLIGEPFSIETTSRFDTAALTFKIDQSKLGDTEFENLMFLWYDEENCEFVELETFYHYENSTVSIETTHFSRYMIVDKIKWFEMWATELDYRPSGVQGHSYDTVIAIDCSGSMSVYDTSGCNSKRAQAATNFINTLHEGDRAGLVTFTDTATVICKLTDALTFPKGGFVHIRSSGGTSFSEALSKSLTLFDQYKHNPRIKRIILLSDGEDAVPYTVLEECKARSVAVYTIGLGSSSDNVLETIATQTGGKFFKAYTAEELLGIYSHIGITSDFDTTDTDGDGLYDAIETAGIRLQNGKIIYTDPTKADTDGDGLLDGEEIDPTPIYNEKEDNGWLGLKKLLGLNKVKGYSFIMHSNPNNEDSDNDGLLDGKAQYHKGKALAPTDPKPLVVTSSNGLWKTHIEKIESEEKTTYGYSDDYYEPTQFDGEIKWNFIFPYLDSNLCEVIVSAFSSFGSVACDFRYDDRHIALHSDTTQWQSKWGYNDFYDWIFDKATQMGKLKLDFTVSTTNQEYAVWAWKGNYLNLGAGAEVGFYKRNEEILLEHWNVSDVLPMTLSLYRITDSNLICDTYYNWLPEDQWWITGFVTDIYDQWLSSKVGFDWGDTITNEDLIQVASVDFSKYRNNVTGENAMYDSIKSKYVNEYKDELIFDDNEDIMWIAW